VPPHFPLSTLLVRWQEGHPACKKLEWWGAGVVICIGQGADMHMAQLMTMPLTLLEQNPNWFRYRLSWVIPDKVQ